MQPSWTCSFGGVEIERTLRKSISKLSGGAGRREKKSLGRAWGVELGWVARLAPSMGPAHRRRAGDIGQRFSKAEELDKHSKTPRNTILKNPQLIFCVLYLPQRGQLMA